MTQDKLVNKENDELLIKEIEKRMATLNSQIHSFFPYPNIELKIKKLKFWN